MDEVLPFAKWEVLDGVKMIGCWVGDVASFKSMIYRVTSPEASNLECKWDTDEPTLYVRGGIPRFLYLWDRQGFIRGMLIVPFTDRLVDKLDNPGEDDWQFKFTFDVSE
jgi:hypothetical protein